MLLELFQELKKKYENIMKFINYKFNNNNNIYREVNK